MKTIVVDGLSALQGGGQTYLLNLFRFFPAEFSRKVRVIALIPYGVHSLRVGSEIHYVESRWASSSLLGRLLWCRFVLPRRMRAWNADLLYCPGGFISAFGEWQTAVAFRSMLPFSPEERRRHSLGYIRFRLALLRWIQASSFKKADLVVFISQFAESVIDILVGARRGQSVVIPHGIGAMFRAAEGVSSGLGLPHKYVAYVSILDAYKAQMDVVRAWGLLRKLRLTEEKLLLVGGATRAYGSKVRQLIAELGLQDEVLLLGNIAYELLPQVYRGAIVNLFASSCENCPNILLEALSAGRAVLCSDYQPMPEFGGNAALYFDPYDPERLAQLLKEMLDDPAKRETYGALSLKRAESFQWEVSAARTWVALLETANGRRLAACAE